MSCTRCATPLEDGDLRCAVCALPVPASASAVTRERTQILRCTECGAAVAYDANKHAPACAFCGAVMAIEEPADPVEVAGAHLPFLVDREAATSALRGWLGKRGFFAPKTLRDEAVIDALQPLCWAAWIVNAKAQVAWTADSDAGSGRSAWAPHAGVVAVDLANIVVPASRGLAHRECAQLVGHYDLGTVSTPSSTQSVIESFDVQRSAARQHVHSAIEAVARVRVQPEVPGSRHRNIHVSCLLEHQSTDRVALPAWVMAYRYRGSPYRAIVHGQRPDVVLGTSPTDWLKVLWVVAGGLAVVAAIVAIIVLSRH
jgi:hypothetical protein